MDEIVDVVVETPRSSRNKYEVDARGEVRFDRRLPGAFSFPADYGYVLGASGSDGEPLDALVLMIEPTYPGVRVRARVIGVFWISTGHGREAKLVCVPEGDVAYRDVHEITQLPETSWWRSPTSSTSTATSTPARTSAATGTTGPRLPPVCCRKAGKPPTVVLPTGRSERWRHGTPGNHP